jgi:predicted ATPase
MEESVVKAFGQPQLHADLVPLSVVEGRLRMIRQQVLMPQLQGRVSSWFQLTVRYHWPIPRHKSFRSMERSVPELEYEETGPFQAARRFLNHREEFVDELFAHTPSLFAEE